MAIDWKTIISEFDGKPTLLQAIGKLRKAVEDETITIQQAQAEIAKLESQQKADEALIKTAQSTADEAKINAYNASQKGDQALGKATTADTKAQAADTKAQQALDLATTNETDIGTLDGQVAQIETTINNVALLKHDNDFTTNGNEFNFLNVDNGQTSGWLNYRAVGGGNTINNISFGNGDGNGTLVNISCANPLQYNHAATKGYVDSNIKNQDFKTFFGNQLIQGTGNIDLYKHHIQIDFSQADSNGVYFDFYSSKNTVCESLTDLKTIVGDSFILPAYGTLAIYQDGINTSYYIPTIITETYLSVFYQGDGGFTLQTIYLATNPFTLTDTVTTI